MKILLQHIWYGSVCGIKHFIVFFQHEQSHTLCFIFLNVFLITLKQLFVNAETVQQ